jgi:hypothetical protein
MGGHLPDTARPSGIVKTSPDKVQGVRVDPGEDPVMSVAVANLELSLFKTRNFLFFVGVIAMNYTLSRPSPVDVIFTTTLFISFFVKQTMTRKFVVFALLLSAWGFSFTYPTIPFLHEEKVPFELLAQIFGLIVALMAAFVSMSWSARHYQRFITVYLVAAVIASILGIIGFALQTDLLTWDSRAKGLFDDPNMYGVFLIPAILFCLYMLYYRIGRRPVVAGALVILAIGELLSFSRAAQVALLICMIGYVVFLNRLRVQKLAPVILGIVVVGLILFTIIYFVSADFAEKFLQRFTVAEPYDLGREGRYGRYLLVLPMILDNPTGIGLLQLDKIFPEPIHNIWLSSFVNYGWNGGVTWIVLFFSSMVISVQNYRRTRSPLAILLMFCLLAIVMCASLHQGEHWRHMWLFYGLVWGFNPRNFPSHRARAAPSPGPARPNPFAAKAYAVLGALPLARATSIEPRQDLSPPATAVAIFGPVTLPRSART